ncbi:hypothetical protein FHG87_017533, partial [Trinorchestia longiramus]
TEDADHNDVSVTPHKVPHDDGCTKKSFQRKRIAVYTPLAASYATLQAERSIVFVPPGLTTATFSINIPNISLYTGLYTLNVTLDWGSNGGPDPPVTRKLNVAEGETSMNVSKTFTAAAAVILTATFSNPVS